MRRHTLVLEKIYSIGKRLIKKSNSNWDGAETIQRIYKVSPMGTKWPLITNVADMTCIDPGIYLKINSLIRKVVSVDLTSFTINEAMPSSGTGLVKMLSQFLLI